jgi:phage replication initiation protein
MVLNEEQWIKELREKRIAYGISQGRLAVASGITREYLNKIESGKMKPSKELLNTLHKELAKFNPEAPPACLVRYRKQSVFPVILLSIVLHSEPYPQSVKCEVF